jgi:tetratricopeptide (TPR) repeat protein
MLKDLTGFLVRVGKYDEAESILRKELELVQGEIDSPLPARKEKVITGNHCGEVGPTEEGVRDWRSQQLQTVSEDLANCLLRERNWAEAETHFRRSLEIQTKRAAKSEIGNPCQGDIWWLVLTSQFGLSEALMMQAKLDEALPIYEKIYEYKRSRFVSPEVADDDYSKLNVLPVVSKLNKLATDFRARATMLQSEGQLKRAIDSMKSATSILRLVPGEQQVNVDNFWQNCALPNFKGRSTAINVGGGWYRASPRPSEIRHAAYKQKLIMSTQGPNPSLQSAVEALQSLETSSSNI